VRHPLLEEVDKHYRENTENTFTVGIAPGSRKSEVKKLFPVMLKAAQILYRDNTSLKFLVPMASGFSQDMYNRNPLADHYPQNFPWRCRHSTLFGIRLNLQKKPLHANNIRITYNRAIKGTCNHE